MNFSLVVQLTFVFIDGLLMNDIRKHIIPDFYRDHEVDNSILRIGQNTIQNANDYKILGVLIDDKLSFRAHVNKVLSKVSISAGLLYKLRNCLPPETRLSFYYSFIYPHFTYNIATRGKQFRIL